MKQKIVGPKTYLYKDVTLSNGYVAEPGDYILHQHSLDEHRNIVSRSGPPEIIYYDGFNLFRKETSIRIAVPVIILKNDLLSSNIKKSETFRSLSYFHKGPVRTLEVAYEFLMEHIWNNSIKISDEIREVYHRFEHSGSERNVTEIQIGLA